MEQTQNKVFVGNLPYSVTDDTLGQFFAEVGEVVEAVVIMDRQSGRSKGFGFVTFAEAAAAAKAIEELNGKEMEGREIIVNEARPPQN